MTERVNTFKLVARWPSARDYREAVADPDALGIPELRGASVERDARGAPKAYTGRSATTFRLSGPAGDLALRCFTRGFDDIDRRYRAIAELLAYVNNDALCRTAYVERAIRVDDAWRPAVTMEWAPDRTLDAAVEERLRDGQALVRLAESFRETVRSLAVLGVAHGDLEHATIRVTGDRLRLIGYDAMFLPAISGLAQIHFGHPNYQHPQRRRAPFDGRLDRFSSIVIYTALIGLSADRSLWRRFNTRDNLIFEARDFVSNGESDVFRALLALKATRGLANVLVEASRLPVELVPTLEQAIATAAAPQAARLAEPPARTPQPSAPFASAPAAAAGAILPERPSLDPSVQPALDAPVPATPVAPPAPSFAPSEAAIDESLPEPEAERSDPGGFAPASWLAACATVVVGLGIGYGLATWPHGPHGSSAHAISRRPAVDATAASRHPAPAVVAAAPSAPPRVRPTHAPRASAPLPTPLAAAAKAIPTARPATVRSAAARPAATVAPIAVARAAASVPPVAATPKKAPPIAAAAVRTAPSTPAASRVAPLQGQWQISEANYEDGTMIWSADAVSRGGTVVVDAYKQSIAGRPASSCERRTNLHAAFALGSARQSVPFQETNCAGAVSAGTVRVANVAPDGRSFSGSFWEAGTKLGDFTATKL